MDLEEETKFEDLPRFEASNPYNYDKLTLSKREADIRQYMRERPNISRGHIEMIWDFINNTPEEEVNKIINEGLWEKQIKKRQNGGEIKNCIEILSSDLENN